MATASSSASQKHDLERKVAPFRKGWYKELVLGSRHPLVRMLEGEDRMAW